MSGEPRTVTLEQINAEIASEHVFAASDAAIGASMIATGGVPESLLSSVSPLKLLTFCVLVLKNGHKVVGINYGAIDPTVHSAELGREDARQDARNKVRDYLGFRLRDQIAAEAPAQPERKRYTAADIADLKWGTVAGFRDILFGDKVNVKATMSDGKEFQSAFTPAQGEVIGRAAGLHILAVANGEAL